MLDEERYLDEKTEECVVLVLLVQECQKYEHWFQTLVLNRNDYYIF